MTSFRTVNNTFLQISQQRKYERDYGTQQREREREKIKTVLSADAPCQDTLLNETITGYSFYLQI